MPTKKISICVKYPPVSIGTSWPILMMITWPISKCSKWKKCTPGNYRSCPDSLSLTLWSDGGLPSLLWGQLSGAQRTDGCSDCRLPFVSLLSWVCKEVHGSDQAKPSMTWWLSRLPMDLTWESQLKNISQYGGTMWALTCTRLGTLCQRWTSTIRPYWSKTPTQNSTIPGCELALHYSCLCIFSI